MNTWVMGMIRLNSWIAKEQNVEHSSRGVRKIRLNSQVVKEQTLNTRAILCGISVVVLGVTAAGTKILAQEETGAILTDLVNEKISVNVGAGLRASVRLNENEADGNHWSEDINLDNMRIYLSAKAYEFIGFELNTDIGNAQGFEDPTSAFEEAGNLRLVDAVGKLEFHDLFNVWLGRFLPPSDRSNLSGPFYLNAWDFPFVQFGYPNIFQGRDDGVAVWGQYTKEGNLEWQLKWQLGVFEGFEGRGAGEPNKEDNLMYSGRLVLNLLDPEPGYYNSSTYYGDKDILALGFAVMHQKHAVGTRAAPEDFTGFNFDFLFEKKLTADLVGEVGGLTDGVLSLEAAYYDFDDNDAASVDPLGEFTPVARQGESYFLLVSYLIPTQMGYGVVQGRLQPFFRYQDYRRSNKVVGALEEGYDVGINYLVSGHNARFTLAYQQRDRARANKLDTVLFGAQLQF